MVELNGKRDVEILARLKVEILVCCSLRNEVETYRRGCGRSQSQLDYIKRSITLAEIVCLIGEEEDEKNLLL